MTKKWSKEDRHHYQNSEVMQEFEKLILDRLTSVGRIQERIEKEAQDKIQQSINKMKEFSSAAETAAESVEKIESALSADDMEAVEETDDTVIDYESEEEMDMNARLAMISELNEMIKVAQSQDDYVSVYKIERTIQKIMDFEDED